MRARRYLIPTWAATACVLALGGCAVTTTPEGARRPTSESPSASFPAIPPLPSLRLPGSDRFGSFHADPLHYPAASDGRAFVNRLLPRTATDRGGWATDIFAAFATMDIVSSAIFDDFIGMVPLGRTFLATRNPVRTGGPMQVSVAFAEAQAGSRPYPYPVPRTLRDEVFTRHGGIYFGVAHLLDYAAPYDAMIYRFADFNTGRYAGRNAAF